MIHPLSRKSLGLVTVGLSSLLGLYSPLSLASIDPASLHITEIMSNPAAVSDTVGEWFEIYNSGSASIDLNGVEIVDQGSNSHTIAGLSIAAGEYLVLGRSTDSGSNGGIPVDYQYSNFTLSNSSDAIILQLEGLVLDSLIYDDGALFGAAGNSAELTASGFQLTAVELSTIAGDIGTPGSAGSFTPASPAEVPIPAAGWLFASALSSLWWRKRRLTAAAG